MWHVDLFYGIFSYIVFYFFLARLLSHYPNHWFIHTRSMSATTLQFSYSFYVANGEEDLSCHCFWEQSFVLFCVMAVMFLIIHSSNKFHLIHPPPHNTHPHSKYLPTLPSISKHPSTLSISHNTLYLSGIRNEGMLSTVHTLFTSMSNIYAFVYHESFHSSFDIKGKYWFITEFIISWLLFVFG